MTNWLNEVSYSKLHFYLWLYNTIFFSSSSSFFWSLSIIQLNTGQDEQKCSLPSLHYVNLIPHVSGLSSDCLDKGRNL